MSGKKSIFKNMNLCELLEHYKERKSKLTITQATISDYKEKLKELRKLEIKESEQLRTITHWLSSRHGIKHK